MNRSYSDTYNPVSSILILSICSFAKNKNGNPFFDFNASILKCLRNNAKNKLLSSRREVLESLWKGDFLSQGISAEELEYNKTLQLGRDFGGNESIGEYLPTLARYDGRFYNALGKEGKIDAVKSNHHFLIMSGLYGLLKPMESIQLYSAPIEHDSIVQKIWKRGDVLTDILIDYIKANQIKRIFDFTSRRDYREIFNWEKISKMTGAEVFHCFSLHASGADSLRFFGQFLKDYMFQASEEKLLNIEPDTVLEEILFRTIPHTFNSLPKEQVPKTLTLEKPLSNEWAWFTYFLPHFFRDFDNLGGVEEKSNILRHIIEIQRQPDLQIKDIQKPYSADKKDKWRKRVSKSLRLVYSFDHESRRITIEGILHK